jgi:hypothetical protein
LHGFLYLYANERFPAEHRAEKQSNDGEHDDHSLNHFYLFFSLTILMDINPDRLKKFTTLSPVPEGL